MVDLAAFNHRLQTTFGADYTMRWDAVVGRWALDSMSAAGRPVVQYWGWFYDATTRQPLEADPLTNLHPYRDLDQAAQDEIVRNLHRSYIGKTGYGLQDWRADQAKRRDFNRALIAKRNKDRAALFSDLLAATDLRRPYLKHHTGTPRARAIAQGGST